MFQAAETSNIVKGSIERWKKLDTFVTEMNEELNNMEKNIQNGVFAEKDVQEVVERVMFNRLFLLNVIKAQRLIDTFRIPNMSQDQIELVKEGVFSFWRTRGITLDYLPQILEHTDKSEIDLLKLYESYLSGAQSK
ncbi:uncharacterized protein PHALS_11904 [Plasmopara halstedii]|uniref:Uncharacterized protein n=1 Tax=Plasmopara halstedii TaxID=4781 RepID=A0A0P1ALR5_PLAHL|nr:uncharacterized protein PHALS_11904 [Plasmopara halstedii]CEG41565.1 hypothetical protein PHALS_11904 [Plasmopara halstedii]|eukprot:XP_024577934.1 hypothetical protein PHALS_11904 [Plasmopara halstedii]